MIRADISNLETEVKLLTVILAFRLSLSHVASTTLCSLSQTFSYMPPLYGMFFLILGNVLCAG